MRSTPGSDPNPSFANDRYRKAHLPIHFEYIEQLAVICSLSALFGYGGQTSGEVLQNRLPDRARILNVFPILFSAVHKNPII